MKQKIRVIGIDGKTLEGEINIPAKDHLISRLTYKHQVYEDKRFKKPKHKKKIFEEN